MQVTQGNAGERMILDAERNTVQRRAVLCGGGSAVLGMIVTALIGRNKPARAAALSGSVPEVDRLLVRSVVDSYQIAVAPSSKVENV
jgi:7,8-dihydropterin-6-yl-methyl-4-(beta-D-ribofuranosyl)aminobenzene 5'-phosphate synthase